MGSRKWWHTASLKLISSNLSSGLRGKLFKKAPAAGALQAATAALDSARIRGVSHEALVVTVVLLPVHDEGKGTLELKTERLREVGDVGNVVVSEAVFFFWKAVS